VLGGSVIFKLFIRFVFGIQTEVGREIITFISKAYNMKIGTFFSCADGFYIFVALLTKNSNQNFSLLL
jgi:hypothetical protein